MNRAPSPEHFAEAMLVATSDEILAEIERGWRPPCTTSELDRVRMDALKAVARDLPYPSDVANVLQSGEPVLADALRCAWIGQSQPYAGAWRIDERYAAPLRRMGIIEVGGFGLTAFGISVRKVLVGDGE